MKNAYKASKQDKKINDEAMKKFLEHFDELAKDSQAKYSALVDKMPDLTEEERKLKKAHNNIRLGLFNVLKSHSPQADRNIRMDVYETIGEILSGFFMPLYEDYKKKWKLTEAKVLGSTGQDRKTYIGQSKFYYAMQFSCLKLLNEHKQYAEKESSYGAL